MIARAISRLANLLRGHSTDRRPDEAVFRRRLNEARNAVLKWKARATEAAARGRKAGERLSAAEQALRAVGSRLARARRETPSVAVIQQVFAHRVHTLSARVSARSSPGREEHLLQVSTPYRTALERGPEALHAVAQRIDLDGLAWWIPAASGKARASDRRLVTHRFPYHGILQTREVAGGGIMLDLGANVGRMAVPRVIFGDISVAYCAEPDPVTFACLARNVIDNGLRGFVLPDQTAIGDGNGTARLLRAGSSGNFRIVRDVAAGAENIVDVPCCTLDVWVERLGIDLDAVTFIKVDVEGFEARVMAGARRVLQCSHIAWQIEVKPSGLRAAGDEPQALYAALPRAFTHFIDLNRRAAGARVRPISELSEALRYIEPDRKTDVLLFSAAGVDRPRTS